jgi:hypothetical protein
LPTSRVLDFVTNEISGARREIVAKPGTTKLTPKINGNALVA